MRSRNREPDGNLIRLALVRGSEGGGGGSAAIADLFGNGEDGSVTVSADTPNFLGGDYTDFTLNAGITVSAADNRPILIRATTRITIDGTVDGSGHITAGLAGPTMGLVGQQLFQFGGSGGGGGGNAGGAGSDGNIADDDPVSVAIVVAGGMNAQGYPLGTFSEPGNVGTGGPENAGGGSAGAPVASTLGTPALAAFTDLQRIRTGVVVETILGGCPGGVGLGGGEGGEGAGGTAGGVGGGGNLGGNGGASIYLVAPEIVFGASAHLTSNGTNGGAATNGAAGTAGGGGNGAGGGGGGGSGGQGGSGGVIGVYYGTSLSGSPTTSVVGGAGGAAGTHGAGGAAGGVTAGGDGSDGLAGLAGSAGFVFVRKIGSKS